MPRVALAPAGWGYQAEVLGRQVAVRREGPLWVARLCLGHGPVVARAGHLVTVARMLGRLTEGELCRILARELERHGPLWVAYQRGGVTYAP